MKFILLSSILFITVFLPHSVFGSIIRGTNDDKEERRVDALVDLIASNLKTNGWDNIICIGPFPDAFYAKMKHIPFTFTISDVKNNDYDIEDVVPYHSNVIVMSCFDFKDFEDSFLKAHHQPYYHPHANIILYYRTKEQEDIGKISFIFWFFKAHNAIVVQYDDLEESLSITYFNPFITENYQLQNNVGCWKATKLGRHVTGFREGFICEEDCHNVSLHSKLRAHHLGTCIGYSTHKVNYGDCKVWKSLKLFEDKAANLHGFILRAHGTEIKPFLEIKKYGEDNYTISCRDGMIWIETSKLMNFQIDLTPSKDVINEQFNFETNIQQIYTFARRQTDILLMPIYQFDVIVVDIDLSIAYKDSGVCIVSHRADFETILFDVRLIQENSALVIQFASCLLSIWFVFFIFNFAERGQFSFNQVGKDFNNTIKIVLSISLHNQPKQETFKIFLTVAIWSFFVINFATQAAIISFFSAFKRGKEVETFDDVIEKGYKVEGMASPDMMLPDTEERFQKINSKLVPILDIFGCVKHMNNDSRRFCLIDCAVGRYLARNKLNEKGEQYLHVAKDRIHSHYLNMIFHRHSVMTKTFNKYLRIFFEAGLIKKWEDYRFNDIKEESPLKALGMDDFIGIFKCYYILLGLSFSVFVLEVLTGVLVYVKRCFRKKLANWNRTQEETIVEKNIYLLN